MAQSILVNGITYVDVPAVEMQKSAGGVARFNDTSSDTVTAGAMKADITAHDAQGQQITGTLPNLNLTAFGELENPPEEGYVSGATMEALARAIEERGLDAEPLLVTENGTYTAPSGKYYTPVIVNVSQTELIELEALANGSYIAPEGKAYDEVTVDVDDPNAIEVLGLTAEHNGLYVPDSGKAYSSVRVHVTTRVTGTGDLAIYVTAPTGCTVTAEKLDGEDEGALYTGVESQEIAGEYTIKVMGYGQYDVRVSDYDDTIIVKPISVTVVLPRGELEAYKKLEYLESTGTQYIPIGYFDNTVRFEGRVSIHSGEGFGGYQKPGISFYLHNTNNIIGAIICDITSRAVQRGNLASIPSDTDFHDIVISDGYQKIDTVEGNLYLTNTASCSMALFGYMNGDTISSMCAGRCAWYKIYSNNILVHDFIPVKRISDDKPGMYDVVRDIFYTNQGTGEFIMGPEIV